MCLVDNVIHHKSFISMRNAAATSIVSGYGIKPVCVDGHQVATVLKFAVKNNSPLHAAYWAAFGMHVFGDRPRLVLEEQNVCKNKAHIRLYCLAKAGSGEDLMSIYRQAQVLIREYEITELKMEPWPDWYQMFIQKRNSWTTESDIKLAF